jgi:DNA primase large subunit
LDDALTLWRNEFSKAMPAEKFDKEHAYTLRHMYGKEGKRTNYSAYSCVKIITGNAPNSVWVWLAGDMLMGCIGLCTSWVTRPMPYSGMDVKLTRGDVTILGHAAGRPSRMPVQALRRGQLARQAA